MIKYSVALLVAVLVSSCASSPPVSYFQLPSEQQAPALADDSAVAVELVIAQLPDYLNRSQLVTRDAADKVRIHEYARWVEPLDDAIHRVVSKALASSQPRLAILPASMYLGADLQLRLEVESFELDLNSAKGELSYYWMLQDQAGQVLVPPSYEVFAIDEPGALGIDQVPGLMAKLLHQAAAQLAENITIVTDKR